MHEGKNCSYKYLGLSHIGNIYIYVFIIYIFIHIIIYINFFQNPGGSTCYSVQCEPSFTTSGAGGLCGGCGAAAAGADVEAPGHEAPLGKGEAVNYLYGLEMTYLFHSVSYILSGLSSWTYESYKHVSFFIFGDSSRVEVMSWLEREGEGRDGLINVSGPHWAGLGVGGASPVWWVSSQASFLPSVKACSQSLKPWVRLIPKGNYFLFCDVTILSSEEGACARACAHNEIIFALLFELHQIRQVICQPPCDVWLTDNYLLPILLYKSAIQREKAIAYMQIIPCLLCFLCKKSSLPAFSTI